MGLWTGPDGKTVIAALNPGGYGSNAYTDLSKENHPTCLPIAGQLTAEELRQTRSATIADPRQHERSLCQKPEPNWVKRLSISMARSLGLYADYATTWV